jgi:hypothetical protein
LAALSYRPCWQLRQEVKGLKRTPFHVDVRFGSKANLVGAFARCPLCAQKQTLIGPNGMSALGQQQTSYQAKEAAASIDDLIARLRGLFELWKPART